MSIYPEIKTIGDITRFHLKERANEPALVFEDRTTTYQQLDNHANQVANGLLQAGIESGDRIAYLSKNNDFYFEILLGLAKSQAVMVGVNWRLAAPEIEYILKDAGAKILFIEDEFLPILETIHDQLPALEQIITFSGQYKDASDYTQWRNQQSAVDPKIPVSPEEIAIQLYTSGTTGHPKGVEISHAAILVLREIEDKAGDWSQWNHNDVALVAMPVFHIGGTAMGLQALYNGARAVIMAMADPGDILALMEGYRVTRTFLVPAVILFLLQHPNCTAKVFESLHVLLYGASPIPLDLLKQAIPIFNCHFVQIYGMTETAGSMTFLAPEDHTVEGGPRMSSCGKPYPGVEMRVVDPQNNPVKAGEVGELLIKTPSLMKGYWKNPEATNKAIVDQWYYSGDAGYIDEDGYVYLVDRVKDMIVSGGENIYPAEIESALFGHPAVKDIAVIGVPNDRFGEEVKAVIIPEDAETADADEIIEFARTQLAGFKIPRSIDFVSELPRNASGKLLKRELRKAYWADKERNIN